MILQIDDEKLQAQADALLEAAADRALKDVMRAYGFEGDIKKRVSEIIGSKIDKAVYDIVNTRQPEIEKAVHDVLQKMIEAKAKRLLKALDK